MTNNVSIQFLGAAGTVTGSKHLLRTPEKNIMVDCGLFQGIKSLRIRNRDPLPLPIADIDLLILTHAHLDHCGYIPLFVKSGYKGRILMTPPTRDLVEIILRDSARIQEEDAAHANKYGYAKHNPDLPLYTEEDVEQALKLFEVYNDNEWITISANNRFRFIKNGHILGSCFVEIQSFGKIIIFSGDIGTKASHLLDGPPPLEKADYLIMESTYGDRLHRHDTTLDDLTQIIKDTIKRKGNLLIPSFAVGRAQEIMYLINHLKGERKIPDVPVFMDSPMGADATYIFKKYPAWHKLSAKECSEAFGDIKFVTNPKETQKIIRQRGSKIVIAASGMLTGGRVLEYLQNYVESDRNTILLVGYQAEGTRGRALKEGANEIKMHGRFYKVYAQTKEITSLSAHADQKEMIEWLKGFKTKPQKIFLVHGEHNSQDIFRVKITDELHIEVVIPEQNDQVKLF